eukprot:1643229-Alexandrium_andersonii.AAC.1
MRLPTRDVGEVEHWAAASTKDPRLRSVAAAIAAQIHGRGAARRRGPVLLVTAFKLQAELVALWLGVFRGALGKIRRSGGG